MAQKFAKPESDIYISMSGSIHDANLMHREIGILPGVAARCIAALMNPGYSHISIRNKRMYVYCHTAGSPSGVTLHDTFPLICLEIAKELKGEMWDLSAYDDTIEFPKQIIAP